MPRILVVDDDSAGLEIRKLILERGGYEVTLACDVPEARAAFSTALDVVLLDVRLPRVQDGLGLIREFRAASSTLRIVVLCGHRGDLDRREEASMADEILSKPTRVEALLRSLVKNAEAKPGTGPTGRNS
jgi:CheY-like chemotaxis protein